MFCDAQIAGLPDTPAVVRAVKRLSTQGLDRRRNVIKTVRNLAELHLNGGGTRSLHVASHDHQLTSIRFQHGSSRRGSSPMPRTPCLFTCRVRFKESEYAVPREEIAPVLWALRSWIDHDEWIGFPVEVRVPARTTSGLSTAYQRETGYIASHHYFKIDHRRYFAAFESIVAEHRGRPHWGKLHTLEADQLRRLYPRFDAFMHIRDRLDPGRTFDNGYLRRVLG
jgi:hypothetical protein